MTLGCPTCRYDLRGLTVPRGIMRCQACGAITNHVTIITNRYAGEMRSRRWMVSIALFVRVMVAIACAETICPHLTPIVSRSASIFYVNASLAVCITSMRWHDYW